MRGSLLIVFLAAGCSKSEAPATSARGSTAPPRVVDDASVTLAPSLDSAGPPAVDRRVKVPTNPPVVSRISFVCSHSNMPWGDGYQHQSRVYDLDHATATSDTIDVPNTPKGEPSEPPPGSKDNSKRTHDVAALKPDHVAKLRAAVARVLAGGPYEPEYPVSEGVSCQLELAAATGEPFFTIDKAHRAQEDAVNDLLNAM